MFGCKRKEEDIDAILFRKRLEDEEKEEGAYVLTYKHEACGNIWTKVSTKAPDAYAQIIECPKCYPDWLSKGGYKRKPWGSLVDTRYEGPKKV